MAEGSASLNQERSQATKWPLAVDLDGTLLRTDTLYETIAFNIFSKPLKTVEALLELRKGKAAMKAALADLSLPDAASLPVNETLVEYLVGQRDAGRQIHLATAADERIAKAVADQVGCFDSYEGTTPERNLKGPNKAAALKERFPDGFSYAGDHEADLPVWSAAQGAVFVGVSPELKQKARDSGAVVEAEFDDARAESKTKLWRRALRAHQWTKNILLFAPLLLAHKYSDPGAIISVTLAFLFLGLVASGTYILNDLSDLASDRCHRTKCRRPFAAGALPVRDGLVVAPALIVGGLLLALILSRDLALAMAAYLCATLSYSFGLKRIAMLDVVILGLLYTLRLIMGVAVLDVWLSPWLLSFSFFFFFAMSLAKRHVELRRATGQPEDELIPGRGYRPADWPVTLGMGAASTFASLLVLVLYLTEEAFPLSVYSTPQWLWAAPALILLWTQRIWLLAHRGDLDDDPVAFAIRDKVSIALGGMLLLSVILAITF